MIILLVYIEIGQLHMYVCIDVYFPPFWSYVGGINLSIRTTNKLLQAYSLLVLEQKLRILVVDQELLLC
jgi:hypothetical protein